MKAIYLNIDPYLQAFADWLNAGKPGTAPSFNPLPVAVTIPLGETACIYLATDDETPLPGDDAPGYSDYPSEIQINGGALFVWSQFSDSDSTDGAIVYGADPGISSFSGFHYAPKPIGENKVVLVGCWFRPTSGDDIWFDNILIPVLVRRETASGPIDLVDFTPPASGTPSAADIKSALVAAGNGALAGVNLNGAQFDDGELKVLKTGETMPSKVMVTAYDDASGSDILTISTPGS